MKNGTAGSADTETGIRLKIPVLPVHIKFYTVGAVTNGNREPGGSG